MSHVVPSLGQEIRALPSRARARILPYVPRAVWRLLPGSSASFGPPRRWQSWSAYRRTRDVGWIEAFPATHGNFPRAFWPLSGAVPFKRGTQYAWPEQGVARLRNARVLSSHGWVVAPADVFLGDFCFGGNDRASPAYHLMLHHKPRSLPGVTLNLCSAHAAINFCHWLLDSVGRLELFERCGYTYADVDHILIPSFPGTTAEWVRRELQLPGEKLIFPGAKDQLLCETLLQPSYPGAPATYSPWVVEFYRRHFPAQPVEPKRRLYFERKTKRGLTNASEVAAELHRWGFEAFDPAGERDLPAQLADVSHVVGVHGASLANLVFAQPGTRVLELMPSDTPWRFYYSLCGSGRMPYGIVVGKSLRERRRITDLPTNAPFTVPMDELRAALHVLVNESEAGAKANFSTLRGGESGSSNS